MDRSGVVVFSIFKKPEQTSAETVFPPVAPETPFVAIGDVHGRFDLLQEMLAKLPEDLPKILVGDVIDRGDQSWEVLRFLDDNRHLTVLRGNHEELFFDFMKSPEKAGHRWLRYGGLQTLCSMGISGLTERADTDTLLHVRNVVHDLMGQDMLKRMHDWPLLRWTGNVVVVHAGANPNRSMEDQSPEDFVWGHPEFSSTPRKDGNWVLHGHRVVSNPTAKDGRIAIDTGAYATGRLTAAIVRVDGVQFLSTSRPEMSEFDNVNQVREVEK